MLLAASFTVTWFSFLMSFPAAVIVVGMVGIFSYAGNGNLNLKNWPVRPFVLLGVLVLIGVQVGFAAAEANQHNISVADQRFHATATHDLKSEHFNVGYLDDQGKVAVLLVGQSNCQLPPLLVSRTTSRHDSSIKWRPVLSATNQEVGLEATDLQSLAKACSAG